MSMKSGEQSLRQRKSIPHGRAPHRERMGLRAKGTKRTPIPLSRGIQGRTSLILQGKAKQTPPDQGSDPECESMITLIENAKCDKL